MDLHVSNRERSGFVRTEVWVVFQLVGLSLWGERERVWKREKRGRCRGFGTEVETSHQKLPTSLNITNSAPIKHKFFTGKK